MYYYRKIDGKTLIATPIQILGADKPGRMISGGTGDPQFGFVVYTTLVMPKEDIEKMKG
jgi:hypothetical protein